MIGATLDENNRKETYLWADQMAADLKEIGAAGGHPAHFKLTEPVEVYYGDNWHRLQKLKQKLNGTNAFRAIPSLNSAQS